MSQIKEINDQILEKILKTDEFYEALWGKEEFTPTSPVVVPNDFNCGAISNALEYIYQFVEEITEADLEVLDDPYLDVVIYFFTGLRRFFGETNTDLLNRMNSLLVREAEFRSERLGTPWDILNVLSYYLDRDLLFYIPNTVLTDLMVNGNFETTLSTEWTILPSGNRSTREPFSGTYKMAFDTVTSIEQTITSVTAGSYILNSFARPKVAFTGDTEDLFNLVVQRSSDSFYYDVSLETWGAGSVNNTFTTSEQDYSLAEFFIIIEGTADITFTFTRIVDFYLDNIEFGEKLYPAFQILYIDSGAVSGFGAFWDTAETNYGDASYTDQEFMFDTATTSYTDTFFQSLIDTTKASGVLGTFISQIRGDTSEVLVTSDNLMFHTSDGLNIGLATI